MDMNQIKEIDSICDSLNRISRTLVSLREELYQSQHKIEEAYRENDRLRDENAKLLIDIAFFDGRLPSSCEVPSYPEAVEDNQSYEYQSRKVT